MKLAKQYTPRGESRLYRLGKDGKEYLFFKSRKQKIIIRDMFETDAENYFKLVADSRIKYSNKDKKNLINQIRKGITERQLDDEEFILMITTVADKPLGFIEVFARGADMSVKVYLDIRWDQQLGNQVIDSLKDMHQTYYWGDNLYLWDINEEVLISTIHHPEVV